MEADFKVVPRVIYELDTNKINTIEDVRAVFKCLNISFGIRYIEENTPLQNYVKEKEQQ